MAVKDIGNEMVELDCPFTDMKIQLKKEDHEHLKKCAKEFRKNLKKLNKGFTFSIK